MDLNLLSTFVAVAETSSFSAAAKRLGVRRSSISRAIAALERELEVQLFTRTTRHVALAAAGEALYAKIAPQLASMKDALGALPKQEKQASGTIRMTAPHDIGAMILPDALAAFSLRYPAVDVDMRLTSRNVDVVAEGFEAALRVMPARRRDSSLIARRLSGVELGIFASPTYLARKGAPRTLAESLEHAWVSFAGLALPAELASLKRVRPRFRGDDVLFVARSVAAGIGLGVVPTFLMRDDVTAGRVVRVLPRLGGACGALYLVTPPSRHVPRKVAALREFLVEYFLAHPLSRRPAAGAS